MSWFLLPALFDTGEGSDGRSVIATFAWALIKLTALIGFALVAGQRIIPWLLGYIARTGSRDLFTLAVLVLALGIAVGSAQLFGASMALGAFLAGMIVGQSEFSARSASEALPMRDAFAVLFFVSVGMLFDPYKVAEGWPLMLATLGIVIIGKPLAALVVVLLFRRPLRSALSIAVALAQIGEFSFILASLASGLNILPPEATNALVVASVVSITLNPLLYKCIEPAVRWLERKGIAVEAKALPAEEMPEIDEAAHRVIVVGYGPVGQTLSRILKDNGIQVVVSRDELEDVQELRAQGRIGRLWRCFLARGLASRWHRESGRTDHCCVQRACRHHRESSPRIESEDSRVDSRDLSEGVAEAARGRCECRLLKRGGSGPGDDRLSYAPVGSHR